MADAQTIIIRSSCFDCVGRGTVNAVLIYVLTQTANGITVPTDPQTLITAAKCYECVIEEGMFLPVLLYIISKTADGEAVSNDPGTLVNDARCLACEIPTGMTPATILEEAVRMNGALT